MSVSFCLQVELLLVEFVFVVVGFFEFTDYDFYVFIAVCGVVFSFEVIAEEEGYGLPDDG